jgi:hypothetical protein
MGKSSSAPAPVDPYTSAAAQYRYGTAAADYSKGLNATDVYTPYGSTTWSVNPGGVPSGWPSYGGYSPDYGGTAMNATVGEEVRPSYPTGPNATPAASAYAPAGAPPSNWLPTSGAGQYMPPATPPQYTETQTLSPVEQEIFNLQNEGTIGQARAFGGAQQTAGELMPQVQESLFHTPSLQTSVPGSEDLTGMYDTGYNRALAGNLAAITPTLNAQYKALDSSLRNSGAHPGDPAYDTAMSQFMAGEGNQLTQAGGAAVNTGLNVEGTMFGQGLQGAEFGNQAKIQQQQLPLQNYLAIEGGGGGGGGVPQIPGGGGAPNASVQAPDIMSAFNTNYQGQLNAANASNAAANANTGAATSLLGSYLMYLALA